MSRTLAVSRSHLCLAIALASAAVSVPGAARSQAIDAASALAMRDAFLADIGVVHNKLIALAQAIPEEKYDWRPTPEVRTVANTLMHVAMEWYFVLPACFGGKDRKSVV